MIFQLVGIALGSVLLSLAITRAIKPKPKASSLFSQITERQKFEKLILPKDSVLLCLVVMDDYGYTFEFTHFTWVDLQDMPLKQLISESWYYSRKPSSELFSSLVYRYLTPEAETSIIEDLLGGKYPYIWCVGNTVTKTVGFVVGNN